MAGALLTSPPSLSQLSRKCGILNRPPWPVTMIALLFSSEHNGHYCNCVGLNWTELKQFCLSQVVVATAMPVNVLTYFIPHSYQD
jgi:hypothetical protein